MSGGDGSVDTRPEALAGGDLAAIETAAIAQATRRARREARSQLTSPVIVVVLVLACWELALRIIDLPRYLLPPPSAIAASLFQDLPVLAGNSVPTLVAILVAFGASVVIGVAFAIVTFQWAAFRRGVYPLLVLVQAVPKVAVAPLLAIWFGFGMTTRAGMGFLIAVFPIIVNTLLGLDSLGKEKRHLALMMGLSPARTFWKIRLPHALPAMFGGFKAALALAVVGVIVGEFVGGSSGLGYLLLRSNRDLDGPLLFAALAVLSMFAIALFMALSWLERVLIPWADSSSGARGQ